MQGPAAKKKWTAEGRGSGKYQGWSKTGIDTYNALVDMIAKQHLNIRNKTILSNFEPNRQQNQDAEETQEQKIERLPTRSVWDWKAQQALFCKDCLVLHPT
jgi:hypothetical protein